mgnify:CR=1 FL=1
MPRAGLARLLRAAEPEEALLRDGAAAVLEEAVAEIDELRVAAPAGCLAAIGAAAGGAAPAQVAALRRYFGQVALALQWHQEVAALRNCSPPAAASATGGGGAAE